MWSDSDGTERFIDADFAAQSRFAAVNFADGRVCRRWLAVVERKKLPDRFDGAALCTGFVAGRL